MDINNLKVGTRFHFATNMAWFHGFIPVRRVLVVDVLRPGKDSLNVGNAVY